MPLLPPPPKKKKQNPQQPKQGDFLTQNILRGGQRPTQQGTPQQRSSQVEQPAFEVEYGQTGFKQAGGAQVGKVTEPKKEQPISINATDAYSGAVDGYVKQNAALLKKEPTTYEDAISQIAETKSEEDFGIEWGDTGFKQAGGVDLTKTASKAYVKSAKQADAWSEIDAKAKEQILQQIPEDKRADKDYLGKVENEVYKQTGRIIDLNGDEKTGELGAVSNAAYGFAKSLENLGWNLSYYTSGMTGVSMPKEYLEIGRNVAIKDWNDKMNKYNTDLTESIENGNFDLAFEQSLTMLGESTPSMVVAAGASMANPYLGFAVMSTLSAGDTYLNVKNEEWFKELSPTSQAAYVTAVGGAEGFGEYLGGRVFKRVIGSAIKDITSAASQKTLKEWVKGSALAMGLNLKDEAIGEIVPAVTEYISTTVAKGEEITQEGLIKAVKDGAYAGISMGGGMTVGGKAISAPFVAANHIMLRSYDKKINDLREAYADANTPAERKIIAEEIVSVSRKRDADINASFKVYDSMSEADKQRTADITAQLEVGLNDIKNVEQGSDAYEIQKRKLEQLQTELFSIEQKYTQKGTQTPQEEQVTPEKVQSNEAVTNEGVKDVPSPVVEFDMTQQPAQQTEPQAVEAEVVSQKLPIIATEKADVLKDVGSTAKALEKLDNNGELDKIFIEKEISIDDISEENANGQKISDAIVNVKDGLKSQTEGKILVYESGGQYYISDGFHRVAEAKLKGDKSIKADVVYAKSNDISEAYHKAKADGSNPELVQAVEKLLTQQNDTQGKQQIQGTKQEGKAPKQADDKKPSGEKTEADRDVRAPEPTEKEVKAAEKVGITPKNLRDIYAINRDMFGQNKVKAFATAVVMDKMIGAMAMMKGVSKAKIYETLEFRKGDKNTFKELSKRGKALFQIVGENANLAENVRQNLAVAREMEAAGKDAKTIRIATGWERGADKKWRYEIQDFKFKKKFKPNPKSTYSFADIIDDTTILEMYPYLAKVQIKFEIGDGGASYNQATDNINVYHNELEGIEQTLSKLLHETQHAIQKIEGFARGGSLYSINTIDVLPQKVMGYVSEMVENALYEKNNISKNVNENELKDSLKRIGEKRIAFFERAKSYSAANKEKSVLFSYGKFGGLLQSIVRDKENVVSSRVSKEENAILNDILKDKSLKHNEKVEQFEILLNGKNPKLFAEIEANKLNSAINKIKQIKEEVDSVTKKSISEKLSESDKQKIAYIVYRRLAGEVEAANVQKRMGMTPKQRRETTLEETEDVARDEQIVLFQGAQTMPDGVKFQIDLMYHGSGNLFDKFDSTKVGTGTKVMRSGAGFYFTKRQARAEGYAKSLSSPSIKIGEYEIRPSMFGDFNVLKDAITKANGNRIGVAKELLKISEKEREKGKKWRELWDSELTEEERMSLDGEMPIHIEEQFRNANKYRTFAKNVLKKGVEMNEYPAYVYVTTIIENGNWIDFKKPVDGDLYDMILAQAKKENSAYLEKVKSLKGKNGREFYFGLVPFIGQNKSPEQEVSEFLMRAGVDGNIGYEDADTEYVVFDENAISIEEVIKFQKDAIKARGAMMMALDGKAIIYALTDPNVSTPLHELAHVFEHYLTPEQKASVLKWAKATEWTVDVSEMFARGFEKYLADGKAPTVSMQKIFDRFKEWLTDIYNGIKGSAIDLELNDEMKGIYAQMVGVTANNTRLTKLQSDVKKRARRGDYTNVSETVLNLVGLPLHKIKDPALISQIEEVLEQLANKNVAIFDKEKIENIHVDAVAEVDKIEAEQKAAVKPKEAKELKDNFKGIQQKIDELKTFEIATEPSAKKGAKQFRAKVLGIQRSLKNAAEQAENSNLTGKITDEELQAMLDDIQVALDNVTQIAESKDAEYKKHIKDVFEKGKAKTVGSSVDISWFTPEQKDIWDEYVRNLKKTEAAKTLSLAEDVANIIFDIENGYFPTKNIDQVSSTLFLSHRNKRYDGFVNRLNQLRGNELNTKGFMRAVKWLGARLHRRGAVIEQVPIKEMAVRARAFSFWEDLLGTKENGYLMTSVLDALIRQDTNVKDGVSLIGQGFEKIFSISENLKGKDLKSAIESNKKASNRVGMLMFEKRWREKYGESYFDKLVADKAEMAKYRRNEKSDVIEAFESFKKDKDGAIDIEQAERTLSTKEIKLRQYINIQYQQNLAPKQEVANAKAGIPFEYEPSYFPIMRVGVKGGINDDLQLNSYDSTINPKVLSDRGKEQKSEKIGAVNINAHMVTMRAAREVLRNYYMYTPLKTANMAYNKMIADKNHVISGWGLALKSATKHAYNNSFSNLIPTWMNALTNYAYAKFLISFKRLILAEPLAEIIRVSGQSEWSKRGFSALAKQAGSSVSTAAQNTIEFFSNIGNTQERKRKTSIMLDLFEYTKSPFRLQFTRQDVDAAFEAYQSTFGRQGDGFFSRLNSTAMSVPNKLTVPIVWMSSFAAEYYRITGESFDYTKTKDAQYMKENSENILDAAAIADRETGKLKGEPAKIAQRTLVKWIPEFIPVMLGFDESAAYLDVLKAPKRAKAVGFLSGFMYRENMSFSDNFFDAFYAENNTRPVAARNAFAQYLSGIAYMWGVGVGGGLMAYVVASAIGGDDEDEEKAKALEKIKRSTDKQYIYNLAVQNAVSLKSAQYGQSAKALLSLATGQYLEFLYDKMDNTYAKGEKEKIAEEIGGVVETFNNLFYADPISLSGTWQTGDQGQYEMGKVGSSLQNGLQIAFPPMGTFVEDVASVSNMISEDVLFGNMTKEDGAKMTMVLASLYLSKNGTTLPFYKDVNAFVSAAERDVQRNENTQKLKDKFLKLRKDKIDGKVTEEEYKESLKELKKGLTKKIGKIESLNYLYKENFITKKDRDQQLSDYEKKLEEEESEQ